MSTQVEHAHGGRQEARGVSGPFDVLVHAPDAPRARELLESEEPPPG